MHDYPSNLSEPNRRPLIRIGAVAAFVIVVLTLAEVILFAFIPQPGTAAKWFELLNGRPLAGIVSFWGLELPMYAMFVLLWLALFAALRRQARAAATVALALVLVGAAVFFATNNPSPMMLLARDYAAAVEESTISTGAAETAALLAAGQSLLYQTGQRAVGGFNIALLLVSIAGVLVSAAMIRTDTFRARTGFIGILAHGFSLLDYVRQGLTGNAAVALAIILPGTLLLIVWLILVGVRLLRTAAAPFATPGAD